MSTFWKNIVNRGVTPDLDFGVRNKVRIFNSSIFIIGCIYIFYTVVSFLKGDFLAGWLTLVAYVLNASCLYFMSVRRYAIAYHISAQVGMIFLFVFSLLYGEPTYSHAYLLFIPVGAAILFDDMKLVFVYFMLSVMCIVMVKLAYLFPEKLPFCIPYYPYERVNSFLGILNMVMSSTLIFLAVRMFRFENKKYAKEIEDQRDLIEEKNKDIVSSIHYARRIQKVLLASDSLLQKNIPDHFVLYKPKDIVSGDFYWGQAVNDRFLLCTGDCTGHGVPGAFMSLLGISFLNEIVIGQGIISPDQIFNHLRNDIIRALNPEGTLEEGRDGMDAVICSFDMKKMKMEFACSNNPIWVVRDKQLTEFKPDKQPIGMHEGERKPFTLQSFDLKKGDIVYTFTDGYADQFGGEKGKKFKYKNLQEKVLALHELPLERQKAELDRIIEQWKGSLDQVDDILLIGIRV